MAKKSTVQDFQRFHVIIGGDYFATLSVPDSIIQEFALSAQDIHKNVFGGVSDIIVKPVLVKSTTGGLASRFKKSVNPSSESSNDDEEVQVG